MGVVVVPDILVSDGNDFLSLRGHCVADRNGIFQPLTAGCGFAFSDGNYYVLGERGLSMVAFRADGTAVDSLSVEPPFHVVSPVFRITGVLRMPAGETSVTFHFGFSKELSGSFDVGMANVGVSNVQISSSLLQFRLTLPEGTNFVSVSDFTFSSADGETASIQVSITSEPM